MTTIIELSVPGVGEYRISATRTGPAAAEVDIATWPPGIAIDSQPAESDQAIEVENIVVVGDVLTGTIDEPWYIPGKSTLQIQMAPPTAPSSSVSVSINVSSIFNKTISAALTPDNHTKMVEMFADFAKPQAP